ncbi:MAG: branched-chain amino acid ABC transporter permease [Chloroflexi bacterium]|nr:branched-chain amino acid ABC transporter permease [Chloroflexota bacterium]
MNSTMFGALNRRSVQLLALGIIVVLLLLPLRLNSYVLHIFIVSFYYIVLVQTWNLLAGYTGQFSLATHTFATLGGYTSGLLIFYYDVPIYVGLIAAPLVTLALGLLLGVIVLRMSSIYLAVATWAFAEVMRIMISANYQLTRGDAGLTVPPLFGTLEPRPYYYLFLGLMLILLLIMYMVVNMPIGSFLRAIRDDELAAKAMGINTVKWRLFVFSFTSCIAGLIGAFYGHYIALLSPVTMQFQEMARIIIMAVIGGVGTFIGPIVGAPAVVILSEYMREFGEWRMVIFALVVIMLMRFERGGIIVLFKKIVGGLRARLGGPQIEAQG